MFGRVGVMVRNGLALFQELEVWDVTAVTKTYALGGQRVALRRDGILSYVHTDHLGSTSVLTNASGHEVAGTRLRYYPFGAPRPDGASGTHNAFATGYSDATFTGQRRDVGTGLYFYGARYYDSAIGRFLAPDSIVPGPGNPQALNRYSYTLNSPLKYTDPTGHFWWIAAGAAVGAIVGAASVALPQMIANAQAGQPLTMNIDPVEVGKAAVVGAAAGAVSAATFGAATAVLGTGFLGTVGAGMAAGAISGQAGRAADNLVNDRELTTGLGNPNDMVFDAAVGGASAAVGYGISKAIGAVKAAGATDIPCSFDADTPVLTPAGLIPIQTLQSGDLVFAYDEATGTTGVHTITGRAAHLDPAVVTLTIAGESIDTTPEHPFYTAARGWVEAGQLVVGDRIRRVDGSYAALTATQLVVRPEVMYNLTVAGAHTFFVGEEGWLVHNCAWKSPADSGKTLQTGGHTINSSTAQKLALTKEQAKIAIEGLKKELMLPNNFHATRIMENGDVFHSQTGELLGNLYEYLP